MLQKDTECCTAACLAAKLICGTRVTLEAGFEVHLTDWWDVPSLSFVIKRQCSYSVCFNTKYRTVNQLYSHQSDVTFKGISALFILNLERKRGVCKTYVTASTLYSCEILMLAGMLKSNQSRLVDALFRNLSS